MIYTIVPAEQLLENEYKENSAERSVHAFYMGEEVMLSQDESGVYTVKQLLSTNPQSFLKSELYPGVTADTSKIKLFEENI